MLGYSFFEVVADLDVDSLAFDFTSATLNFKQCNTLERLPISSIGKAAIISLTSLTS